MPLSPPAVLRPALRALAVGVALGVTLALLPAVGVGTAPASATSTYLCTGYTGCAKAGYSHAGYKKARSTMWWAMYSGHNCTNYVAYRMVKAGMPNKRPWTGSGNATYWGTSRADLTDRRPMVGSVAWWKANTPGAGSAGHVAYVERVVSRKEIVISEDSWSGDFHWRRLVKDGPGWPAGFIHFRDRKVVADRKARVSGQGADGVTDVGDTLRVDVGSYRPRAAKVSVRWLSDGAPIKGARSAAFRPDAGQVGHRISVAVHARLRGYVNKVATRGAGRVHRGTLTQVQRPVLGGRAQVEHALRLDTGAVSPRAAAVRVAWFADGTRLKGADGRRLDLGPGRAGQRITAQVAYRTPGYRARTVRTATTTVRPGHIGLSEPFATRGTPRPGRTLTAEPGVVSTPKVQRGYRWLRDGRPMKGATDRSYTLTKADIGHRVALRVSLRRPGYERRTLTVAGPGWVRSPTRLRLDATGHRRRAAVEVRVRAAGVPEPGGRVTVRIDGKVKDARVERGRAKVVLRGLPAGRHRVRALYSGTRSTTGGKDQARVRVPRS